MELTELKDRIEKYFKEVDPDELYELALSCAFKQVEEETGEDKSSLQQSKREPIVLPTPNRSSFENKKLVPQE